MIKVVNMIPAHLSDETHQDSEPNLSVNPNNTTQIVGTAFSPPESAHPDRAPIYISTDGGDTWELRYVVPHGTPQLGIGTHDITARFATKGNTLYVGDLRGDATTTTQMDVLRTANF